jgi:hypothetical protein
MLSLAYSVLKDTEVLEYPEDLNVSLVGYDLKDYAKLSTTINSIQFTDSGMQFKECLSKVPDEVDLFIRKGIIAGRVSSGLGRIKQPKKIKKIFYRPHKRMDRQSPPKLPSLPEEISSRIIRRAGKGAVSRRHQEVAKAERYRDAGTKPFTKREVMWVYYDFEEMISVFGYEGGNEGGTAEAYIFSQLKQCVLSKPGPRKHLCKRHVRQEYDFYIRNNGKSDTGSFTSSGGQLTGRAESSFAGVPDPKDVLINRLDSGIIKESNFELDEDVYAEIVLPDLRCMYHVLLMRFRYIQKNRRRKLYFNELPVDVSPDWPHEQAIKYTNELPVDVSPDWPHEQAIKYTKQAFNNIVDDFQDL